MRENTSTKTTKDMANLNHQDQDREGKVLDIFIRKLNLTNEDIAALKQEKKGLGRHPEEVRIKRGSLCIPLIIAECQKDQQVDPHRLSYEIFRLFNIQQFVKRTAYGMIYGLEPTYVDEQLPHSAATKYFNKCHRVLTYGETAHLCATVQEPTEISCRNFDPSNVRKMPTLRTLCKNYIHCELALTYEVTKDTKFVTYHYQPQIIEKLSLPKFLRKELTELYYNCQFHNQYYGFIYKDRELNRRWYFRKGTKLYEELVNKDYADHMLYRLYTLKEIQNMSVIYASPQLKNSARDTNNFGQVRERR